MSVGFVALWNNTPCEYRASEHDEWSTTERIQAAFAFGRSRGIRTYGLYSCRWCSPWQYLTFWVAPDLGVVTATIADLERAGDFKFAESEHIVGRFTDMGAFRTPDAWDRIPEARNGAPAVGLFLAWRQRSGAALQPFAATTALASMTELEMLGEFDCRFSTAWDQFTFWVAPQVQVLERALGILEREGAFVGTETRAVVGRLERYYRFASHLQTGVPWSREEGGAE